jgi:hypothetical protein
MVKSDERAGQPPETPDALEGSENSSDDDLDEDIEEKKM